MLINKIMKEKDLPAIIEDENITVSERDAKILSDLYYKEGMTFGRDALYHHLKKLYPNEKDRPSRRTVMKWISKQKLAQQFSQTRSGGTTNYFVPVSPFHSMSVDLIDFNFKPSGNLKYIIVLVDNFSRKMFTAPITGKTADKTTKGMEKIFKKIKDTHGQEALDKIKYINSDDGSEFKGSYDKLLKGMTTPKRLNGIKRFRTLGGNPAQNGLVERQNGKVKMILAKLIKIKGGSWGNHLDRATDIVNKQLIRTTKYTPDDAVKLSDKDQQKLRDNVKENQDEGVVVKKDIYKRGDRVRLKLNKGTLGKSSTPNWSDDVYEIGDVIKDKNPQIADKYKIVGRAQDQRYSRNDLQRVKEVEEIPRERKLTAKQVEEMEEMLRLDEDSIVEGAFSDEILKEQKARMALEFPDQFEKGNEKTTKQLERLGDESEESNKGKKVQRPIRKKNKPVVFKPEEFDVKKKRDYEIEDLVDTRYEGDDIEYLIKWKGFPKDENTWEREFFRKGKNEIEAKRNIPKGLVDAFKKRQKNPKASTKKMDTTSPKRVSKVVNLASKGKGRKLM